jgi:hypothetical protein
MNRDSSDVLYLESSEVPSLDHIIEIHIEEIKGNDDVVSENEVVFVLNDVSAIGSSDLFDGSKDCYFVKALFVELVFCLEDL